MTDKTWYEKNKIRAAHKKGEFMTKEQYFIATKAFLDAFFQVTNMPKEVDDFSYYCAPIGGSSIWIVTRNLPNQWYEISKLDDDEKWHSIRRVYASTKGCISSLLKAYLDYCEEEEKGNVAF